MNLENGHILNYYPKNRTYLIEKGSFYKICKDSEVLWEVPKSEKDFIWFYDSFEPLIAIH
ncbi:MAG: hypothetical protein B6U95_02375 [Thermofilum sp. ex4484_82]|nr:MAG: hypothetical protein B6U95_02375 [Thermofilum sp. ex4484_82]